MIIEAVEAIKIPDSRHENTLQVFIKTSKGKVSSSVPSGKSRGKYEISPFSSKGIDFSVSFIKMLGGRMVSEKMSFKKFEDLEKFENLAREYDKSPNFELLGGNALLAVEYALLKAMALDSGKEVWQFLNPTPKFLPRSLGNCIGGGMHVKKEKKADIQEFLLSPKTKHFYDSYFINLQAYRELKKKLIETDKGWNGELTDEKAMASSLPTEYLLTLIRESSESLKKKYGFEIQVGIDMASSTFFDGKNYVYKNLPKTLDSKGQMGYVSSLIREHSLFYVEDPFQEEDFESFSKLTKSLGKKCLIVGDDLTATNYERLERAIKMKSINALIIKPNQNGSLIRTKKVLDLAKANKIIPIISHRSGETPESIIADLAIAWEIPFMKAGILGRERLAKLHRVLHIERQLGSK